MNCCPFKMDSSEARDLGYHTQQFVHARPRDAGSGFVLTPSGGLRICIPSDGSNSSQYVSATQDGGGRPDVGHVASGPTTQVFRIGPRYNASVMSANVDRRGSVDSGLAHVIRLGAGRSPQVFRIRGGAGSDSAYVDQQPNQTSRVIHVNGPGLVESGSGNSTAPGRHQVIRIGPQGVRVTPAGNGSPPARVYRVVPFAGPTSDSGDDQSPHVSVTRITPGSSEYQQSPAGNQSPVMTSSNQPRLVRYSMNPSSSQPVSMTSSAGPTTMFVTRGQLRQADWQEAADVTDRTGCGGYIPGVGAVYRCRPRDTGNDVSSTPQQQQQMRQVEYQFKNERAPPLSTVGRTASGESSIGSYSPQYGNNDMVTSQAFEPRRFRVHIGSEGGGSEPQSRQCSSGQQQPVASCTRIYPTRVGSTSDGSGSPVVQSGSDSQPTFTVRTVGQFGTDGGQITDFGELICESIRQFLTHKQHVNERNSQQQQQQQQHVLTSPSSSNPSAVPWRVARDYNSSRSQSPQIEPVPPPFDRSRDGSPSVIVGGPDYSAPPTANRPTPPGSVTPEDRNLFQKYKFQFESIGNFGRSNSRDDLYGDNGGTGSGSWNKRHQQQQQQPQPQPQPLSRTGPIAVFCFQDFDDMVAKMREMREGIPPFMSPPQKVESGSTDSWVQQQQQQQHQLPRKQLQCSGQPSRAADSRQPNRSHLENEDDGEDSGYHTGHSSQMASLSGYGDSQQRASAASFVTNTPQRSVATNQQAVSREKLRHRIAAFNSNNSGSIISLTRYCFVRDDRALICFDQHSDVYHGIIRVHMNLIRPVQMTLTSQPPSMYDVVNGDQSTTRDVEGQQVTTFHLPKDTTKVIHISSETTTKDVIRTLLSKFRIRDNPRKFALYEKFDGTGTSEMRRLNDNELPLPLCLSWAERGTTCLENYTFVLQENDTGEILWEAFSLPELENFLMILNKEEEEYLKQITQTYRLLKIHFQRRAKDLKKDRIGPGARLQQHTVTPP